MSVIEQLENLDFNIAMSDDVLRILEQHRILNTQIVVSEGTWIYRSRRGHRYFKSKDLTYCPAEKCKHMQRATLPFQTTFYGVISGLPRRQENARYVSLLETSQLLRDITDSSGREKFSVSCWEVIQPLNVVSLVTSDTFPDIKDNPLLNQLRDSFLKWNDSNSTHEERCLASCLSKEFEKVVTDEKEYLISATIASDLLKQYDGVIYPSVQTQGKAGLNIALAPEAADLKLRYLRVFPSTLFKYKDRSHLRMDYVRNVGELYHKLDSQASLSQIAEYLGIGDVYQLPLIE